MSKLLKALSVASLSVAAASVFAGGVEPGPAMVDATGMFVGVGGGINTVNLNNELVNVPQGYQATITNGRASFLAPYGQIGYWGHLNENFYWGVKAFYKYLNTEANSTVNISAQPAGVAGPTSAVVRTAISQEAAAQLMIGTEFHGMLPYVAGGVLWLPSVTNSIDAFGQSQKENMWGGIFSVGARRDISKDWFIDSSYSYGFTGTKQFDQNLSQRVSIQSVDVSVNYRLAI